MTPTDPLAAKAWYRSKATWLGVLLTLIGVTTYFGDPAHTPAMTVASISEAVGGIAAIVLRVWYTTAPIAGTNAATQVETAKQDIALNAALNGAPPPHG